MPLDIPSGSTCFVDANIFIYHFVELGSISNECRTLLNRISRREVNAVTTAFCLADAVHRVMAIEAQERFKISSGIVGCHDRL